VSCRRLATGPYAVVVAVLFILAGGLGLFAGITGALAA
jgi:type IV secretory pathway VirB2 component (pilin)